MRTITVKFSGGYNVQKGYAYLTDDETIKEGDVVVVDSPNSGYTCVRVVSVEETVESVTKAYKWIVQKVDDTPYKARIEEERRKAVIRAKLDKAVKEARERIDYEALAKINPEIAALLKQL